MHNCIIFETNHHTIGPNEFIKWERAIKSSKATIDAPPLSIRGTPAANRKSKVEITNHNSATMPFMSCLCHIYHFSNLIFNIFHLFNPQFTRRHCPYILQPVDIIIQIILYPITLQIFLQQAHQSIFPLQKYVISQHIWIGWLYAIQWMQMPLKMWKRSLLMSMLTWIPWKQWRMRILNIGGSNGDFTSGW